MENFATPPRGNENPNGWGDDRDTTTQEVLKARRLRELYNQMDDACRDWKTATSGNAADYAAICMHRVWQEIRQELGL